MTQNVQSLRDAFPHLEFSEHEVLAPHTYMKAGGPADIFTAITDKNDLENVVIWCEKHDQKYRVLGGASNILVPDEGVRGLVIKNMVTGVTVRSLGDDAYELEAQSGTPTNIVVRKALDESLEGMEYFLGVPGTIGGAVYNNSHYMNQLVGNFITEVDVIAKGGIKKTLKKDELKFEYDYSVLQETNDIVLSAKFLLKKGDKAVLEQRAKEATIKRATTQPLGMPSSGCIFKNPIMPDGKRGSAGKLIDQAGLKGTRMGNAMVSDKHASFIVNLGGATTEDILKLADHVKAEVKKKFGVELHHEVFTLS